MPIRQGFMIDEAVDFDAGVEFAAREGFDFIELNMNYTFARGRINPNEIRETIVGAGVEVIAHLPYRLDTGSPHEQVRNGACRELEKRLLLPEGVIQRFTHPWLEP